MHTFISKKIIVKVLLVALAHTPPTLDAWSTNRLYSLPARIVATPTGSAYLPHPREANPLLKPFADHPSMYVATNADLALAEWLRTKHRKLGTALFWATEASHVVCFTWNVKLYNDFQAGNRSPKNLGYANPTR